MESDEFKGSLGRIVLMKLEDQTRICSKLRSDVEKKNMSLFGHELFQADMRTPSSDVKEAFDYVGRCSQRKGPKAERGLMGTERIYLLGGREGEDAWLNLESHVFLN